jgi:hypothetical protein
MDSFPVDTPSVRGGDGQLNNLDLIATLRRVSGLDVCVVSGSFAACPHRVSRGLCSPNPLVEARRSTVQHRVSLEFGDPVEGQGIPVYAVTSGDLALAGLSFGLGTGDQQALHFVPSGAKPTLVDEAVAGMLAAAWLEGVNLPAGRTLVGYLQGASSPSALKVYGVVADSAVLTAVQ